MSQIRVGIIGCGVITEVAHLPALEALNSRPTLLVDMDSARLERLASAYGRPQISNDWRTAIGAVDAAIIATPNHLHMPIATALLDAGIHVLVEKPMARTSAECEAMLAAAERSGALLMVGHRRRYLASTRWLKMLLDTGRLTNLRSFDLREGYEFDWPVGGGFWNPEASGGGVLLDMGSHLLDQLQFWLGPVADVAYRDDADGGVEADCVIDLTMASGVKGRVELSRMRRLRNSGVFVADQGTVEVGLSGSWAECKATGLPRNPMFERQTGYQDIELLVKNWLAAIAGREAPAVTGAEAASVVALIERCYAEKTPLTFPWDLEAA